MPAISFSVFKDKLLSQTKTQTIRRRRKYPIQVGDRLQIYWKQRKLRSWWFPSRRKFARERSSTDSEKLFDAECTRVQPIVINSRKWLIYVNELKITQEEMRTLALSDGFETLDAFFKFFSRNYGDLFEGDLIHFKRIESE
ncbi:hypothetical protein ACL6C3_13860 [Capilliphycus salinus ALCB114379]|uniref:hypothetical protein n=1 Tax=Capilliphycus salinus TaxID=2768948 RepID=UPI0039A49BD3